MHTCHCVHSAHVPLCAQCTRAIVCTVRSLRTCPTYHCNIGTPINSRSCAILLNFSTYFCYYHNSLLLFNRSPKLKLENFSTCFYFFVSHLYFHFINYLRFDRIRLITHFQRISWTVTQAGTRTQVEIAYDFTFQLELIMTFPDYIIRTLLFCYIGTTL